MQEHEPLTGIKLFERSHEVQIKLELFRLQTLHPVREHNRQVVKEPFVD